MKHLRLFERSHNYGDNELQKIETTLLEDVRSIFADFNDTDSISISNYYIARGFIEVSIGYEKDNVVSHNLSDSGLDDHIDWKRRNIEVLEEISVGVKRLKDMYSDLVIQADNWNSIHCVKIRISL